MMQHTTQTETCPWEGKQWRHRGCGGLMRTHRDGISVVWGGWDVSQEWEYDYCERCGTPHYEMGPGEIEEVPTGEAG